MSERRFDDHLGTFLRWQAEQTAGAPSADAMATLVADGVSERGRPRGRLGVLAVAAVVAGTLLASLALAAGISRPAPDPVAASNGWVVYHSPDCGLIGRTVTPRTQVTIAPPVDGCRPRGSIGNGEFAGLIYADIDASADGSVLAIARHAFCGGCGGDGTPKEWAAQGVYIGAIGGPLERIDIGCAERRCHFRATISPDGRRLAYQSLIWGSGESRKLTSVIRIIDLEDRHVVAEVTLSGTTFYEMAWSPDSRTLASIEPCGFATACSESARANLVLYDGENATSRTLVNSVPGWTQNGADLRLSGDLEAAVFGTDDQGGQIERIDLKTGAPRGHLAFDADPYSVVASDGSMVAATDHDYARLIIVDAAGTPRTLLDRPGAHFGVPIWSPRNDALLVSSSPDVGPESGHVVPLDGGATTDLGPSLPLAWLPAAP